MRGVDIQQHFAGGLESNITAKEIPSKASELVDVFSDNSVDHCLVVQHAADLAADLETPADSYNSSLLHVYQAHR